MSLLGSYSLQPSHSESFKRLFNCVFLSLEKLGFFSSSPAYSCKDIRDSGDSRGDGEYWIDPEKNGNPFKVFCDMTTDGGRLWWRYEGSF